MSLIYCRTEPVMNPFEVPELGVHLHSSQELCYVIYENPLLVMDDFIDNRLIQFIRDDLNMEALADRLESGRRSGESSDNLLLTILSHCQYYLSSEVSKYRQTLIQMRKKHPAEYRKAKADYLFERKQYGRAIPLYEKLLEFDKDTVVNDRFFCRIWCCLGACHARLFQFDRACRAYDRAFSYDNRNEEILERMYFLKALAPELSIDSRYQVIFSGANQKGWEKKMADARAKGWESPQVKELDELFQRDPVKRLSGAAEIVKRWKQDYRGML